MLRAHRCNDSLQALGGELKIGLAYFGLARAPAPPPAGGFYKSQTEACWGFILGHFLGYLGGLGGRGDVLQPTNPIKPCHRILNPPPPGTSWTAGKSAGHPPGRGGVGSPYVEALEKSFQLLGNMAAKQVKCEKWRSRLEQTIVLCG